MPGADGPAQVVGYQSPHRARDGAADDAFVAPRWRAAAMPATTSVSIRSPTMTVLSECASMRFSALRNIIGLGLPTKYGSRPVALVIIAATDPVAGSGPSADGPVTSGLVAMNRAPARMSRTARVIASNEYVRVSPSTTKSGPTSVSV